MFRGLELRSVISSAGELRLSLEVVDHASPGPGEVLVQVEAASLNPTDHYLMTGPADFSTLEATGTTDRPVLKMTVPPQTLPFVSRRLDKSMPVGSEGAGTVVAAGSTVEHLIGKRVAAFAGGMFTQLRRIKASDCVVLPDDISSVEGAAMFVNPLTVLGFIETMRDDGCTALVHAAAASNLGQMLAKTCIADGIPLVNIVRRPEQVTLLRELGAAHVIDSSTPDFEQQLVRAVSETGARLAFDPIGGGKLTSQILSAMEAASVGIDGPYQHYGSDTPKKVYIYGGLDRSPTVLERRFGFAWSVGGWLLFHFMNRVGADTMARLRSRVLAEVRTTFASHYTQVIGLKDILDSDVFLAFQARATGEKYLVNPTLG